MLIELRCNKLIKNKLEFGSGLNSVTGPDDGSNSIGKSSVLMLIDFALSGNDFVSLCSDVIENVGDITVEMDFLFNNEPYSFSRSTSEPSKVIFFDKSEKNERTIEDYRKFLKDRYLFPDDSTSFRGALNPFLRIWGKDNYTPNRPLNSFPNEPFSKIKPNLLKLFSYYHELRELEKEKLKTESQKKTLKGAFDQGYIKPLTKRELKLKNKRLVEIESQLEELKGNINLYTLNIKKLINEESLKLKSQKDSLLNSAFKDKNRLKRINDNLKFGSTANKRYFDKLKGYFPSVDESKLAQIDSFHTGVTKILKTELLNEKQLLEEKIKSIEEELKAVDQSLTEAMGMIDKPSALIDKMLELSLEEKELRERVKFRELKETIDIEVSSLSDQITEKVTTSLAKIEVRLNSGMATYIEKFYEGAPVSPEIKLSETRYEFKHNDDSGTGKAYANLIAMDMCFLEETYLPILIHDLIVFKNIEVHAIERIIIEYLSTNKQIFIAIDELNRYNQVTQKIIREKEFLTLDSTKLAFGKSWKKRT